MKAILVLAGGLGTRLRSVVGDMPKPLADVAGKPFLWWLLRQLELQGAGDVYLSVGYRHETIRSYFGDRFGGMRLHYVVEEEPLGTGGAVLKAITQMPGEEILILNGDTLAVVNLNSLLFEAEASGADVVLAVAEVADAARYGTVEMEPGSRCIKAFLEKGRVGAGAINAGVYVLRKSALTELPLPAKFSFEQDFLGRYIDALHLIGYAGVTDFIDIGIPEDYQAAQTKVPRLVTGA